MRLDDDRSQQHRRIGRIHGRERRSADVEVVAEGAGQRGRPATVAMAGDALDYPVIKFDAAKVTAAAGSANRLQLRFHQGSNGDTGHRASECVGVATG